MPISPLQPLPVRPALRESPSGPGQAGGGPGCSCPPGEGRPLPDPAAVRLCPVPDPAPPYDAPALPDARVRWLTVATADGSGTGQEAPPEAGRQDGEAGTPPEADRQDGEAGHPRQAGSGAQAGEAGPAPVWPSRFAQALAETLAGARPPRQMEHWTTERARTHIRRLGAQLSAGQPPRIRRIITTCPAPEVVEMTVVMGFGPQVRALAIRLERTRATPTAPGRRARPARWVCTTVEAA